MNLLTYEPENKYMFNGFKNIMPGDVIEQKIVVENKSKDKSVRLYLQANPISAEDKDFLSQMALAIYNGDDLISDDNASSQGSLSEKVYLGTIAPNSTIDLTAKLHCSITMNNDFASQEGKINWIITAEEKEPTPTDLPQTGDNNKTIYVVMLLSCSLAVLAGTIFIKKRKDA